MNDPGRASRILGAGSAGRSTAIATVSTVIVFGAIALLVVTSAGWPEVKQAFFNWDEFTYSFPKILRALKLNIEIFLIAEVFILIFALGDRDPARAPGPGVLPAAAARDDRTRTCSAAMPTILVIYLLGFGVPALQLSGVPSSELFWGDGLADPRLLRVRGRGVPRRHRVGAPEPGRGGALARA